MFRVLKSALPKSLFGRALLIVVLPTLLAQAVAAYVFFDRHWDNVTKHMGGALAGEVAFLAYQVGKLPASERDALLYVYRSTTGINGKWQPEAVLKERAAPVEFQDFKQQLSSKMDLPFTLSRERSEVRIDVQLKDGVLLLRATSKRLESGTITIFFLWMGGATCLFLCIALVFLRNQVRPIRELAEAAEEFGKGRDIVDFKPHGATEVRRAGRAFMIMRERLKRQMRTRTEMLAGISHDLRTPLTRMKLQLAMQSGLEAEGLSSDVAQMEQMVGAYLDFARGAGGEDSKRMYISNLLYPLVEDYARQNVSIPCQVEDDREIEVRPFAFRRMLANLVDNALRYGKDVSIAARMSGTRLAIIIDDSGPGIPQERRQDVFRPFTRLDASRNPATGGVGLGLSVARDIAQSHGGDIMLETSPSGGLRVVVRVPV